MLSDINKNKTQILKKITSLKFSKNLKTKIKDETDKASRHLLSSSPKLGMRGLVRMDLDIQEDNEGVIRVTTGDSRKGH